MEKLTIEEIFCLSRLVMSTTEYHKESLAVKFTKWSEINGGNKLLLEEGLAKPLKL